MKNKILTAIASLALLAVVTFVWLWPKFAAGIAPVVVTSLEIQVDSTVVEVPDTPLILADFDSYLASVVPFAYDAEFFVDHFLVCFATPEGASDDGYEAVAAVLVDGTMTLYVIRTPGILATSARRLAVVAVPWAEVGASRFDTARTTFVAPPATYVGADARIDLYIAQGEASLFVWSRTDRTDYATCQVTGDGVSDIAFVLDVPAPEPPSSATFAESGGDSSLVYDGIVYPRVWE